MKDVELYEQLLGVQSPWKVKSVQLDYIAGHIVVKVGCQSVAWVCPVTGRRAMLTKATAVAVFARQYKTVNLYSISLNSWNRIVERLTRYVSESRLNDYYEAVFAEMVADGTLSFDAVFFDADQWYEIDTMSDLYAAEDLFTRPHSLPTAL